MNVCHRRTGALRAHATVGATERGDVAAAAARRGDVGASGGAVVVSGWLVRGDSWVGSPPRAGTHSTTSVRRQRRSQRVLRRARATLAFGARVTCGIASALFAIALGIPAFADAPGEVHGSGDAYAAPGVTLAWGILHGTDESSTQVVIRVAADSQRYPVISAVGKNPFGGQERVLLAATAAADSLDVRVPRSQFADFPRTELRFYASGAAAAPPQTPALIVYYLGVPDTTPELADERKLDAYLDDRIARARAAPATGKTR